MRNRLIAIPVNFDGETIDVPQELRARGPGEVLLLVGEPNKARHSWRDVIGKLKNPRSEKEMDLWLDELRNEWDEP